MRWKQLLPKLRKITSTPNVFCVHLESNDIGSYRPNSPSKFMKNDITQITAIFCDTVFGTTKQTELATTNLGRGLGYVIVLRRISD